MKPAAGPARHVRGTVWNEIAETCLYKIRLRRLQVSRRDLEDAQVKAVGGERGGFVGQVRITKPAKPPPMAGRKQEVLQLRE